jgi:hypothetical protein
MTKELRLLAGGDHGATSQQEEKEGSRNDRDDGFRRQTLSPTSASGTRKPRQTSAPSALVKRIVANGLPT